MLGPKVKSLTNVCATMQRENFSFNSVKKIFNFDIDWPEVKSTMAFKQLYSALSTCRALSFSTCSWKMRIWSMKATTRSAAIGEACRPAAASSGATCSGMEHCAALRTNSSDQARRSSATWSVTCRSGKKGIFRDHSTALNSKRAASSQMFSMPMMLFGCMHWPYREVGYGSARNNMDIKLDRYVCPFSGSPLSIWPGNPGCWVGGILPRCTAENNNRYILSTSSSLFVPFPFFSIILNIALPRLPTTNPNTAPQPYPSHFASSNKNSPIKMSKFIKLIKNSRCIIMLFASCSGEVAAIREVGLIYCHADVYFICLK